MQCRFSTPLTDEQLWAVLDGEGDSAIERHLDDCPDCSRRLTQMAQLSGGVKNMLHRFDCPTPDQLADYHMNLASPTEASAILKHLPICASCRHEMASLEQFLNAGAMEIEQPERFGLKHLREIIATLLPRPLDPAFAARGEETNKMTAKADSVTVFIEVESLPDGFTLTGQLLDSEKEQWNGALVEIRSNDTFVTIGQLDEDGEFRCVGLPGGTVALRITAENGRTVLVNDITL